MCLSSHMSEVKDPYTLALMAYAYSMYEITGSERALILDKLDELAIDKG